MNRFFKVLVFVVAMPLALTRRIDDMQVYTPENRIIAIFFERINVPLGNTMVSA